MPLLQDILHLGNQLILIGHIEYIPGSEDIVGQTTQSILGSNTVLVAAQNDTNGRLVLRQPQKFKHIGVTDNVLRLSNFIALCSQRQDFLFIDVAFGLQQPCKQGACNLQLKLPDRPVGIDGFFFIKAPFVWIGDGQQLAIMGPAQFARQCLAFLIGQIKLPHILQV